MYCKYCNQQLGSVDFDSERELNENATPATMEFNLRMFMERNAYLQHDKQQTLGELADQYRVEKAREVPGDPSYCIQEPNGHVRQVPPAGIYERHEHKGKENADGIPIFTICDTPEDCCGMNHLVIGMASTGALPTEIQEQIMNYFKDRPMYRHTDNVYGHFDICYYCLIRRGRPVE